nr:WhiB family transcriptional regulator [Isoptericola halotolerans]
MGCSGKGVYNVRGRLGLSPNGAGGRGRRAADGGRRAGKAVGRPLVQDGGATRTYPTDWALKARCRAIGPQDEDADPFFHPEQERGPMRRMREQRAKAVCAECPVAGLCLEAAMRVEGDVTTGRYGVYGGYTPEERVELLALRQAADDVAQTVRDGQTLQVVA